jgi:hypothetical protein
MHLIGKMSLAALLLSTTMAASALADNPLTTGCPAGTQRLDGEGGAGGNWQQAPGQGVQRTAAASKTEGEGGAGGNWQQSPGQGVQQTAAASKTGGEGGAGGNWQPTPGSAVRQTAAVPCK